MRPPAVSILIPVYNGEPYLAECLDSILAQDVEDYELLLADDGSKDNSRELIEAYARRDSRVRWWRNPQNLGLAANFNACLRAATGKYIKYVLQDDKLLHRSAVRRMLEILEHDSSVSLVASAANLIDADSKVVRFRDFFGRSGVLDGKQVIVQCLKENANLVGEPSLVLFRKEQGARGFDERFRQLVDLDMWFHLLELGRFAFIAEPLCAFRMHPAQQTEVNRRSGAAVDEPLMLAERYLIRPWLRDVNKPMAIFRQMYSLRKHYGTAAAPLLSQMSGAISPRRYAACWMAYKVTRPFQNLRRWLEKRGIRGRKPPIGSDPQLKAF